jgi:putative addiction module antidote
MPLDASTAVGPTGPTLFPSSAGVITFVITLTEVHVMPKETTIRAIGNSAGTTIPKAMLQRYRLAAGDRVYLVETDEGILITPFDPDFVEAMEIYEEGAKAYRNAMRELAK